MIDIMDTDDMAQSMDLVNKDKYFAQCLIELEELLDA
jgi:hypothetical protein